MADTKLEGDCGHRTNNLKGNVNTKLEGEWWTQNSKGNVETRIEGEWRTQNSKGTVNTRLE